MESPFIGIYEKLKRADESINNLNSEVVAFFEKCDYRTIPHEDPEETLKAIEYHRSLPVPRRFSVLAGEIVHHMRSSLDHLVWMLSLESYRTMYPTRIEFPIFDERPANKDEISRYERKVGGITSARAREIIEGMQPYNSPEPTSSPLSILHHLNIIDKHRELVLFVSSGYTELPEHIVMRVARQKGCTPEELTIFDVFHEVKEHGHTTPQIAFGQSGWRKVQPIIPGLLELAQAVRDVFVLFAEFE